MTNRLHTFLTSHLDRPLDTVYARIDEDQLDGVRRPAIPALIDTAVSGAVQRAHLRHLTH